MSTSEDQLRFIKNNLINQISDKFPNEIVINHEVSHAGGFDGFMSTIYLLDIKTLDEKTKKEKLHKLIAKFMKSNVSFRKSSKSYEQFSNEIFIYSKVLPYYEQIVNKSLTTMMLPTKSDSLKGCKINNKKNKSSINVKNWTPLTFYAEYGLIQGLSDGKTNESILVLENLKPLGYRSGPRCFLDRQHLLLSIKILAEYHAFSYSMRIKKDPMLQEFIEGIIPLSFIKQNNIKTIDYSIESVLHHKTLKEKKKGNEEKQEIGSNNILEVDSENISKNQNIRKRKFPTDVNYDENNLNFASSSSAAHDLTDVRKSPDDNDNIDEDENDDDDKNTNEKNSNIDSGNGNNLYEVLYRVAFDRFFMFIEKLKIIKADINANVDNIDKNDKKKYLFKFIKENNIDNEFFETLDAFKLKWYNKPTELLEYIRCNCIDNINSKDDVFPVILHGDFNRNNLMYQYDEPEGFKNPIGVKMIDFQELRYGSPAIDLSFHMYMNMEPSIRDEFWIELLKFYHDTMINTLANVLNVDVEHESLNPYRFEKFNEHFAKYAFYGALVCMHFLPWMTCSEEEVEKLSHHFATDMHSNDFRQISIEAGGEESDKLIVEIVQHAIKMGYMKNLL